MRALSSSGNLTHFDGKVRQILSAGSLMIRQREAEPLDCRRRWQEGLASLHSLQSVSAKMQNTRSEGNSHAEARRARRWGSVPGSVLARDSGLRIPPVGI